MARGLVTDVRDLRAVEVACEDGRDFRVPILYGGSGRAEELVEVRVKIQGDRSRGPESDLQVGIALHAILTTLSPGFAAIFTPPV